MSKFKWIILTMLIAGVLVGCSSDEKDTTTNDDNTTEETNEDDSSTTDENTNPDESKQEDEDDDEQNSSDQSNNGDVLSLGETGKIESNFGDYEITVNSFKTQKEFNGEELTADFFLLVDFTVKNVGSEPLNGEDVYWAELFDDQENMEGNQFFDSVEQLTGEIAPGETANGQFVFNAYESEFYQLVFNYGALEEMATSLTWEFTPDEASN